MNPLKQIVAALVVCLPLAVLAQEATKPADPGAPAAAPVAEAPKPAPKAEGIKVTWYGFIMANVYANGGTIATKNYPGAATFNPAGAGGALLMSGRQTRFGLRLAVNDPNFTGAEIAGNAEFDFQAGNLPTAFTTTCTDDGDPVTAPVCTTTSGGASTAWNANVLRMRVATVSATWKGEYGKFVFLAGQAPGLVNTLFAESAGWVADPIFWQAGQIWRRAPQVRLSYGGDFGVVGVSVEAAGLSGTDAPPAGSVPGASFDYGAGNRSRMPELEGRLGLTVKPGPGMSVAVGGAINSAKRTYGTAAAKEELTGSMLGVDADISVPYVQVKGEFYKGKGMEDAYNGMTASIAGPAGDRTLIKSSGYWAQAILKPIPEFWLTAGYGTGKGDEDDLDLITAAATRNATRAKNTQLVFGGIVNAGKAWKVGLEYAKVTTEWLGATVGSDNVEREASQVNFSTRLNW